ncbi:MAG: BON domain-containing protein [Magnetococcales bacterium]|nr:BON domain-containing protein [Magnetococcales bacterium]
MNRIGWLVMGWVMLGASGCVPVALVGTGLVTTSALGERRGPQEYFEDHYVAVKIRSAYMQSNIVKLGHVNVSVYRGDVLLTGSAESEKEISEAVRIAKETRGVLRVASELKVQPQSAEEIAKDSLIGNAVKMKILADEKVRGLDIHVETTKSVVYLTGMAHTVGERDQAIKVAGSVDGVREVVSYIEVKENTYPVERKAPQPLKIEP